MDHEPARRTATTVAVVLAGLLTACGLVAGTGLVVLHAFNPVADEWVCSKGQAPAGNACYKRGSTLPAGVTWHPFGNRPMPYNCDKDGWMPVKRPITRRGASDIQRDCVREGTELPGRWRVVQRD